MLVPTLLYISFFRDDLQNVKLFQDLQEDDFDKLVEFCKAMIEIANDDKI